MHEVQNNKCWKCKTEVSDMAIRCLNCNSFLPSAKIRKKILIVILCLFIFFLVIDDDDQDRTHQTAIFSSSTSGLSFKNAELFKNESCYRIVGEIQNRGNITWKNPRLRANYYDKNERLVDTNTAFIPRTLGPSETTPFKIVFGCCEKECNMSLYDHYSLSIENANFSKN